MSTKEQVDSVDELAALKSRADLMNIQYHPSIGVEKLREKVNAALADTTDSKADVVKATKTDDDIRNELIAEATKLVRIRVTCMNPAKKEWTGDVFTVGNSVVGSLKKFVPFNTEDGWHVPHIIYEHLISRECQVFYTAIDSRGNKTRKGKLIKEFSIEVLPPLSSTELGELARRQAMAGAID